MVGLNVPMYHAKLLGRVQSTICVTNHMSQEDLDLLGFDSEPTVQEALERAIRPKRLALEPMPCSSSVGWGT